MGATTIYFQSFRFVRQLIDDITEINGAMIELTKVTNASTEQLKQFEKQAASIGKELGTSASEVINIVAEISKLGYELDDAIELGKVASIGKVVGDLDDVGDSVDYLVSTLKGFRIEAEKSQEIIDYMNHVANTTSINFSAIGEGYKRMSSAMSEANNTLEESTGLLTAGFDITRDAEKTATALRFSALRLRQISEEGEDLSGLLPQLESQFNKFGLTLMRDETTYKSTYEIFKDLSSIWSDINDLERSMLLESVAGTRNSNTIAAIIQNFDTAEKVANSFAESHNSSMLEHQRYLQGVQANQQELSNSMTELNQKLLDSSTIIKGLNIANAMVQNTTALGKFNYALVLVVAGLAMYTLANRKALKSMTDFTVATKIGGMKTFTSNIGFAIKALLGFDVATKGATVSATALNVATGALLFGLPLLAQAFGYLINRSKEANKELLESAERLKGVINETERVDVLVAKKKELDAVENKSIEQKEELLRIEREIAQLLPQTTSAYDEQNQALATQVDLIERKNNATREEALAEAAKIKSKYEDDIGGFEENVKKFEQARDKYTQALISGDYDFDVDSYGIMTEGKLTKLLDHAINQINEIQPKIDAYKSAIETINAFTGDNTNAVDTNTNAVNNNANAIQQQISSVSELSKLVESAQQSTQLLSQAETELNDTGHLSIATFLKLSEQFSDFANLTDFSSQSLMAFINTKREDAFTTLEAEKEKTQAIITETRQRIESYKQEIASLQAMAQLRAISDISLSDSEINAKISQINQAIAQAEQTIAGAESRLVYLNAVEKSFRYANTQSKKNTQKAADEKYRIIQEVENKIIAIIRKRIELEKKDLDDSLKDYEKYINDKLSLLEEEYDQEDYLKSLQEEREKSADIQRLIDQYMLDDSLEARNKVKELTENLSEQEQKIIEMQSKRTREERKKNLQQQLQDERDKVEEKKAILDAELEEDKLYLAAKQAILTNSMQGINGEIMSIQNAFIQFENRFGAGLGTLGDKIKNEFIQKIKLATGEIKSLDNAIANSNTAFSNKTVPVQQPIIVNPKTKGGGWEHDGYYAEGGVVDYTGTAMVHGSKNNAEVVFNAEQAKKLYDIVRYMPSNFTPKTPQFAGVGGGISLNIDSLISIDGNVDQSVMPSVEQVAHKAVDKIMKQLSPYLTRR